MKYKTLFVSDLHIGSSHSNIEKITNFLKENEVECIFLVGDIIDGWLLKRRWKWRSADNLFVQKLLRQSRKGVLIVYIVGNHDEFMTPFQNSFFGNIKVCREAIHDGVRGKYLIIHGDKFDGIVGQWKIFQKMGGYIYDVSIHFTGLLRVFGIHWSFSSFLKRNAKSAINHITAFRRIAIKYAKSKSVRGIILGHIHTPEISSDLGIEYMNIGDMVESNSVLVETIDGEFKLLFL